MNEKFSSNLELDPGDEQGVNDLLNLIIEDAGAERASDIHFNSLKEGVKVRYRVDGILRDISILSPLLQKPLVKKIKERALMNIDMLNKPQDGKMSHEFKNKYLDIRVSSLPSVFGENLVMRILDKSAIILDSEKLGFCDENLKTYRDLLQKPYGLIIITGPTGCGKTTTGYVGLKELASPQVNIMTVEDPVECVIDNVVHTQVNAKEGITFPMALRSMLRQDPDIVYCGEIRDDETAKMLLQLALTGHLVISFLHAENAMSAVLRLIDCGCEPFLVASALLGIISQRLVRKICSDCKEAYTPPAGIIEMLKQKNLILEGKDVVYRGRGCEKCHGTGYRGRTAVHEILVMDDDFKNILPSRPSYSDLEQLIREKEIASMRTDGFKKALEGIISVEEVMRVCVDKKGSPI